MNQRRERTQSIRIRTVPEPALLVMLVLTLTTMAVFDRPLVVGDGIAYLIWLDSIALDGDLDLGNQANKFGAVNTYHIYRNEQSGRWASAFPLGVALLLVPFYRLGAWLDTWPALQINDPHFEAIQSVPFAYSLMIMLGINLYTLLTLVMGYSIARRFTSPWFSALATLAGYLGTPLLFYSTVEPLSSHPAGAFAATLFLWLWLRARTSHCKAGWCTTRRWLGIGLAAGLAALCRWQLALLALPVGAVLLLGRHWRKAFPLAVGFLLLAWIIPYSWMRMFGSPWVVPAAARDGSTFLYAPVHSWRVLTSPIAGLFPWSPVTALTLLGLWPLLRRDWPLALTAASMFVLQALVSGMVRDWWAGSGFGMRRLSELYPVYVLLLSALLGYLALHHRWLLGIAIGAAVVCTIYGVALLLAHLNYVWTNPFGLARDTPLREIRYAFAPQHWRLMWPVIKDHVGIWAWKKPGP